MKSIREISFTKLFINLLLFIASFVLNFLLAQQIAEHFFFDKLYYYKSVRFGYLIPGKSITYADFGKRVEDIQNLFSFHDTDLDLLLSPSSSIAGTKDDQVFTVVVFGDSYVWGQGLQNKDRFVSLLERKLNRVKPARVVSLGAPGDSILDHFIKYRIYTTHKSNADLFIFTLVDNDLLFDRTNKYDNRLSQEVLALCDKPIFYSLPYNPFISGENAIIPFEEQLAQSFSDSYGNLCVLNILVRFLPRQYVIYFDVDGFRNRRGFMDQYISAFKTANLPVFSTKDYYEQHYKKDKSDKDFIVSAKDFHPSALANRMFAEVLFNEIVALGYLD